MSWKKYCHTLLSAALCAVLVLGCLPRAQAAPSQVSIQELYTLAGGNSRWYTEESYWAEPVVVDLDKDGKLEVINAAHTLSVMDAATGQTKWKVNAGKDRSTAYSNQNNSAGQIYCTPKVGDVDGDGKLEIVVGYNDGSVSVLTADGYFQSGWPQTCRYSDWPSSGGVSVRSLALGDLDGDGKLEIVVGIGVASPVSVFVYRYDGTLAPGWPQLKPNQNGAHLPYEQKTGNAFSYGIFNDSIALGDLDGDGLAEIIVPTDTAYIDAYNYDGSLVNTCQLYGNRAWGKIALYEDYDQEIACENEGWGWPISGTETRKELYRAELGHSKAVYTDVDGDGVSEVVVSAPIADRTSHTRTGKVSLSDMRYTTVFILNQDRSRFKKGSWNWRSIPRDLGRPLKQRDSVSMVGGVQAQPVCSDLDGDGTQEILLNSFNGKLHCFWLDGTEHGSWPFTLPKTQGGIYEYACAPACVDLNGDGDQEVIFASWTDCEAGGTNQVDGALYILSAQGELLGSQDLHSGYKTYEGAFVHANGAKAGVTVQDVDGDGRYEALVNTSYYALCAYELAPAGQSHTTIAYPSTQNVEVDGKAVPFQMYALKDKNGNSTNYVKLRDLAKVVDNFNVTWDPGSGMIRLFSRQHYRPNGTEGSTPFSGQQLYTRPGDPIDVNGTSRDLDMIRLTDSAGNGYSYYKLRDLGSALGFTVGWTQQRGVYLETVTPVVDKSGSRTYPNGVWDPQRLI